MGHIQGIHFVIFKISCHNVMLNVLSVILLCVCVSVERHTKLLCSTLVKARRISALYCLILREAKRMRTLSLGLDGRYKSDIKSVPFVFCTDTLKHTILSCLNPLRSTWLLTVGLWEVCRGMAAQETLHHTTLPQTWRSSFMCPHVCPLTQMTL